MYEGLKTAPEASGQLCRPTVVIIIIIITSICLIS